MPDLSVTADFWRFADRRSDVKLNVLLMEFVVDSDVLISVQFISESTVNHSGTKRSI